MIFDKAIIRGSRRLVAHQNRDADADLNPKNVVRGAAQFRVLAHVAVQIEMPTI